MGRKKGSGPYGFLRGNPWRNENGKFCSKAQDLDGFPHSHPNHPYTPDSYEFERKLKTRNKKRLTRNLSS